MKTAILSALLAVAAPTVTLHPTQLDRGPDVPGPHVEGKVLHDGSTRIPFKAGVVTLLGTSPVGYVVHLMRDNGTHSRVVTVSDEGARRTIVRKVGYAESRLSEDGRHLLVSRMDADRTRVRVLSVVTGAQVRSRWFRGDVSVLDADRGLAVLGAWTPDRTFTWTWRTGRLHKINDHAGYTASISADRVAALTGDPYVGGCSVLTDLDNDRLSRSCSHRVVAISPSGGRVATVGILEDGPGPAAAQVRRATGGKVVAEYRAPYVFGSIRWQDDSTLLLDTLTKRRVVTVRCVLDDCERASRWQPSPIA